MSEVAQEEGPIGRSESMSEHGAGPPQLERRHSFRVHLPGRASLWRDNQLLGHYRLHDLSIAGCALVGRSNAKAGDRVELVLHLNDDRPLWLSATIRRCQGHYIALRFERPNARVEDRLQDVVVETYARTHLDHGRFSLVIEPNASLRRMLVRNLDAVGHHAVGVATPLDAVQLLLERGDHVHAAFLGPPPQSTGPTFELIEYLARYHPTIRRVLVGDGEAVARAETAELAGDIDARLELPCSEDALRLLVHRLESLRGHEDTLDA